MNRAGERQLDALGYFVEYGIVAFRMTKDGQIAWIKDVNLGWVSADRWMLMNRVKGVLESPLVERIIEGGYELNAALLETIGGKALYAGALIALYVAYKAADWQTVLWIVAGLVAPFGSIILLYLFGEGVQETVGAVADVFKPGQNPRDTIGAVDKAFKGLPPEAQSVVAALAYIVNPGGAVLDAQGKPSKSQAQQVLDAAAGLGP